MKSYMEARCRPYQTSPNPDPFPQSAGFNALPASAMHYHDVRVKHREDMMRSKAYREGAGYAVSMSKTSLENSRKNLKTMRYCHHHLLLPRLFMIRPGVQAAY